MLFSTSALIFLLLGFVLPILWVLAVPLGLLAFASAAIPPRGGGKRNAGKIVGCLWRETTRAVKTRECPYCGKLTPKNAINCTHCGECVVTPQQCSQERGKADQAHLAAPFRRQFLRRNWRPMAVSVALLGLTAFGAWQFIEYNFEDSVFHVVSAEVAGADVDKDTASNSTLTKNLEASASDRIREPRPSSGNHLDDTGPVSVDLTAEVKPKFRVVVDVANLRSGPSTDFVIVGHLTRNQNVVRLENSGKWMKVRTDDGGLSGWVYSPLLETASRSGRGSSD